MLLHGYALHAGGGLLGELPVDGVGQLLVERFVEVGEEGGGERARGGEEVESGDHW